MTTDLIIITAACFLLGCFWAAVGILAGGTIIFYAISKKMSEVQSITFDAAMDLLIALYTLPLPLDFLIKRVYNLEKEYQEKTNHEL